MYIGKYLRIELHIVSRHPQSRLRLISNDKHSLDKVLAILSADQTHVHTIEYLSMSRWNWLIRPHSNCVYKYTVNLNHGANGFSFAQRLIHRLWGKLTCAIEFATYSDQ